MKKNIIFLLIFSVTQYTATAQLILKKVDGTKKSVIPIGTMLTLKFPLISRIPKDSTEGFYAVTGNLYAVSKDTLRIVIKKTQRQFNDFDSVNRNNVVLYNYPYKKVAPNIPLKNFTSITEIKSGLRQLNGIGAILMLASLAQGLVVSPLLQDNVRKNGDKIMWGMLGTGLVFAILPSTNTYYLKHPNNGKKRTLWQLATP